MNKKSFNDIIKKLDIDETFTKEGKKQKKFNSIRKNTVQKANYNMMADLLELPTTSKGYRYCFVICDLFSRRFDIEPIKNKDSQTVLNAMKECFKRPYIDKPYASIRTDDGNEFKGVFFKYLHDNSILHKVALPNRHKQMANVEALNKQLARLFNGYMNKKEKETKKVFREWTDIIPIVRKDLNEFRENLTVNEPGFINYSIKAKYNVGDVIYEKLDTPENALGHKQNTKNFRVGDYRYSQIPKKIIRVVSFTDKPYYRYILEGLPNTSYSEYELMKAKDEDETKYEVYKIIGKRTKKKKVEYLIWWKNYRKNESTWEPEKNLIEDGFQDMINDYNQNN